MTGKKRLALWLLAGLLLLAAACALYVCAFYRADARSDAALCPDAAVRITRTDYGWLFDGPSDTDALIFYPGGKVEETAYAPLLHELAAEGMDVCLVKMPLRLAVLARDRADAVIAEHAYENWYVGGHSLGGTVAALYASEHGSALRGLVLLAAYPTKPLDGALKLVTVCGTEDGVLSAARFEAGRPYWPEDAVYCEIEGGNHAQFGSYGPQRGDGEAQIPPEEQWAETAALLASLPKAG